MAGLCEGRNEPPGSLKAICNRSSTRVCVRICVSIRRPEFECSGPQLEGPEFEYSELSLKVCGSRYRELDQEEKKELAGSLAEKKLATLEGMANGRRVRGRRRCQMIDDIKIFGSYEEIRRKAENRKDYERMTE
ncbi:hypothetical protein ANN_25139 [Periplaneta americana]|uniref:Uncharacterized protein n=1 Tax=Periplaneta americana TaxID=6978 RepID=A0ABQ8S131_PERAM|nr:hypothetical protein ANN_25139 [Periplaneta americana]